MKKKNRTGTYGKSAAGQERPRYLTALAELMESDADRASILLRRLTAGAEEGRRIQEGSLVLHPPQLRLAAAVFEVSEEALGSGKIEKPAYDLEKGIASCRNLYRRLIEDMQGKIERAESQMGIEHFFLVPAEEGKTIVFRIYDPALTDYARTGIGNMLGFASPAAALDAACRMEKEQTPDVRAAMRRGKGQPPRYYSTVDDGIVFVYDRKRKSPIGDDAILAVIDRDGNAEFMVPPDPGEESVIRKMYERARKKEGSRKHRKEAVHGGILP